MKIFQPKRTICHTIEYCNNKCNEYILDIKVSNIVNFIIFLIAFWTIELLFKIIYDFCVYCSYKNPEKTTKKYKFITNASKSTFRYGNKFSESYKKLRNIQYRPKSNIKWIRKNNRLKRR